MKRCKHPWCILRLGHKLPHCNKRGFKWSNKTCVDHKCGNEFTAIIKSKQNPKHGWTPCCRNTRWWNEDGSMGGPKHEVIFCPICRCVVGQIEIEQYLRSRKRLPAIFHDDCLAPPSKWWSKELDKDVKRLADDFRLFLLYTTCALSRRRPATSEQLPKAINKLVGEIKQLRGNMHLPLIDLMDRVVRRNDEKVRSRHR